MSADAPVTGPSWMTWPGVIVLKNGDGYDVVPVEELKHMCKELNQKTSFHMNDVYSFDGNNNFTFVFVNKLNPIMHQLNVSVEEFRKEFFA